MASGQRKRYWWREKSVSPEREVPESGGCVRGSWPLATIIAGKSLSGKWDIRKYTAWKNGEFCFNDDTLEEILEELGRWYDVKVIFRSAGKKDIRFSGHLKRYENIQKILGAISESTGIVFHISDRMIIVE